MLVRKEAFTADVSAFHKSLPVHPALGSPLLGIFWIEADRLDDDEADRPVPVQKLGRQPQAAPRFWFSVPKR
jgi:hypothetical protein